MESPEQVKVTSAEFVRHFGRWQDLAASQPVVVTHHGRGRVVLVSAPYYERMLVAAPPGSSARDGSGARDAVGELMEHIDQGFIAFDADMRVTALNRAACCFLKVERDAIVGRILSERLPGIEDTLGYARLSRTAKSGSIATLEMPSFAYEGRWLLFQTFPHSDGAACLFRDITEELDARSQIDAKAATIAALAIHGDVGRAKLSARGTFTDVDAAFAAFAKFTPEALVHARLNDIVVVQHRNDARTAIEAVLEGGERRQIDVDLLTRDGGECPVRIGLAPLRVQNGPNGAVAVVTHRRCDADLSDRTQAGPARRN